MSKGMCEAFDGNASPPRMSDGVKNEIVWAIFKTPKINNNTNGAVARG